MKTILHGMQALMYRRKDPMLKEYAFSDAKEMEAMLKKLGRLSPKITRGIQITIGMLKTDARQHGGSEPQKLVEIL